MEASSRAFTIMRIARAPLTNAPLRAFRTETCSHSHDQGFALLGSGAAIASVPGTNQAGVSLVELMVAVALGMLVMGILTVAFVGSIQVRRRASARIGSRSRGS